AKEKADKWNMKIDFVLMDMKELAFRREIFDIAAFLGDPISLFAPAISSAIFDQVYEILKPGGKIILNYRNWLELVQSSVLKKLGVKTYINYIDGKISLKHRRFEFDFYLYAPFILEYMLKKSGFVNIETKKFRTDGLILPQVVTIAIKQI
ncbi:MAG: class I SAM-dependent methyltransferase, partial [bacterium]